MELLFDQLRELELRLAPARVVELLELFPGEPLDDLVLPEGEPFGVLAVEGGDFEVRGLVRRHHHDASQVAPVDPEVDVELFGMLVPELDQLRRVVEEPLVLDAPVREPAPLRSSEDCIEETRVIR